MSAYLVTREGQELGTFKTSKIEKGLKTGFFRVSDLGWCDASGWQGLFEIAGSADALASPSNAALMKSAGVNPDDFYPSASSIASARAGTSFMVPPAIIAALTNTRPWVRFIAVVMGMVCALMIPACLILAVDGAHFLSATSAPCLNGGTQNLILPGTCLLGTLLILYPAVKLSNFASTVARLPKSQSLADLVMALTEQQRFWRFCGIALLILVGLGLLLIIGSFFVTRAH